MTSIETAAAITSAVIIAVGAPAALFHREIAKELRAIRDHFAPHPLPEPDRVAALSDRPAPIVDRWEPQAFPAIADTRPTPASPVPAFKPEPFKAPDFKPDPFKADPVPAEKKDPPPIGLKKDGTPKKKPGPKPQGKVHGSLARSRKGRKAA